MASRGSFQKRQKEAARKEKRQMKLDRRQGRAPVAPMLNGYSANDHAEQDGSAENGQDEQTGVSESQVSAEGEKQSAADAEQIGHSVSR